MEYLIQKRRGKSSSDGILSVLENSGGRMTEWTSQHLDGGSLAEGDLTACIERNGKGKCQPSVIRKVNI